MTGTATTRDVVTAHPRKHVHHGRTPAAWVGIAIAFVAFAIGCWGVAVVSVPLMIAGGAVLVLALVVTQVLRVLGHGAD